MHVRARTAVRAAVALLLTLGLLASAFVLQSARAHGHARSATLHRGLASVSVFASGLNNPRGLAFGPDGYLYVAEGGTGGSLMTTPAECQQVPAVGPYSGGFTSRISKLSPAGVRTTVADGLPSSQTQPMPAPLVSGVSALAFVGGTLYGTEAGAGCSHGLLGTDNTLFRVNADGTTTTIADLSAFIKAHPVAHPDPDDFEPDGTWYGLVAVRGALYATEPNHQEVDRITPDGTITRVIDMSRQFSTPATWQGPTGIAYHGNFYLSVLGTFPTHAGAQGIYKLTPSGQLTVVASGFTALLGVAFDSQARLYALEMTSVSGGPAPFTGDVVRINDDGTRTTIASGLMFPTAMTFGPDGALYVSNFGFGGPPGAGQILRVAVS